MNLGFPKLKHPRLCRLLTFVIVVGGFLLPFIIVCFFPVIPDGTKAAILIACLCALLVFLLKEFLFLMASDMFLASLSCYRTARTQYKLPAHSTLPKMERRIAHFGTECAPTAIQPQPDHLRYSFRSPWTVYSSGIERVVAAYHVQMLDADTYRSIFSSAKANSKALTGRKKALFLDKQQKKAALNRVTVIVIFAKQVDPRLVGNLYKLVCQQNGDAFDNAVLPCVIDLSRGICTFNSLRMPYIGFGYAVINRGVRLIRRFILGGKFPLTGNQYFVSKKDSISLDQSLWSFLKTTRKELIADERETAKKLKRMADKEIRLEDDFLYLKWGERAVILPTELHSETQTVCLEDIRLWSYPKSHPIDKNTIQSVKERIHAYYKERGISVTYSDAPEHSSAD